MDTKVAKFLGEDDLKKGKLSELQTKEFLGWADESFKLVTDMVYQDKGAFLTGTLIPPKSNLMPNPLEGLASPVLSPKYQDAAQATAKRRMVVAGYRLNEQLRLALSAEK